MRHAIIILGSPNDRHGNLLPIAVSRADAALAEFKKINQSKLLCTGGYGEHFNRTTRPHGKYLQEYLMSKGVSSSSFLEIALSAFTIEDATLSKPILEQHSITHCTLVTSDFHMARAKLIFQQVMPNFNFDTVMAKTNIDDQAYQQLVNHEKTAIKRDLAHFKAGNA